MREFKKFYGLGIFCVLLTGLLLITSSPVFANDFNSINEVIGKDVLQTLRAKKEVMVVVALTPPNIPYTEREKVNMVIADGQRRALANLDTADYTINRRFKSIAGFALTLKSEKVLFDLAVKPNVERIDVDAKMHISLNQSRPQIQADSVHAAGVTGVGRVIGVIDTGIDTDHPDLIDSINGQHCFCHNCCPDGTSEQDGPGSAEDEEGHGTHVSGIITSNGHVAPLGIAPGCEVFMIKAAGGDGSFYTSDTIASLDWIYNNRRDIDAVNMSIGSVNRYVGDCDSTDASNRDYSEIINKLRSIGILVMVASGNDSDTTGISSPACIKNAIAVGASWDNQDRLALFSNTGSSLDIFAPGRRITSCKMGGGAVTYDGTSMASPHVAAVMALLRQNNPAITSVEAENALETSPVSITDSRNGISRPRVDCVGAINAQAPDTLPVYRFWSERDGRHFYTLDENEYLYILANYSDYIWHFETKAFYAYKNQNAGTLPVYRFWSDKNLTHFYTISETEKNYILNNYPDDVWRYETIAWYANQNPTAGMSPVYRFWSPAEQTHFYTISDAEKDYIIANYSTNIWTYEGVVWYSQK